MTDIDLDDLLERADHYRKEARENDDAPLVHALLTGETDPQVTPRATPRTRAAIEDAAFMAHHGETLTGAAQRLGITPNGLERMLTRYGLHNTHARLRHNATQKET